MRNLTSTELEHVYGGGNCGNGGSHQKSGTKGGSHKSGMSGSKGGNKGGSSHAVCPRPVPAPIPD
jgi:hypothetical protein